MRNLLTSEPESLIYPWTSRYLVEQALDDAAVRRLQCCGLLRAAGEDRFEIVHDRLLNWAAAHSLVDGLFTGAMSAEDVANLFCRMFEGNSFFARRFLGHVPGDLLWLLASRRDGGMTDSVIDELLSRLEAIRIELASRIYRDLLPKLGARMLPHFRRRLEEAVNTGTDSLLVTSIEDAMVRINVGEVADIAKELLVSDDPRLQRVAMRLLSRIPTAGALDRLWMLHVRAIAEAKPFLFYPEEHTAFVYEDSFAALRACCKIERRWVEDRIERANAVAEPVHELAYLIANIGDASLYLRVKAILMVKIPRDKERALATCMRVYRNREDLDWLSERTSIEHDFLGMVALEAIAEIDPLRAWKALATNRSWIHQHSKQRWLPRLFLADPAAAERAIQDLLSVPENRDEVLSFFHNLEDYLTGPLIDAVLDNLEELIAVFLTQDEERPNAALIRRLRTVARCWKIEHLDRLRRRQGSEVALKLEALLKKLGPRPTVWNDASLRKNCITALYKIDPDAFCRVVVSLLEGDNRYGKIDGMYWAWKRPTEEILARLGRMAVDDELWDEDRNRAVPFLQIRAMEALGLAACWVAVIPAILRWNWHTQPDIRGARFGAAPLGDEAIRPILKVLETGDEDELAGVFIALGVAGRKDLLDVVRQRMVRVSTDSRAASAAAWALGILRDESSLALQFLNEQLDVKEHRWHARCAALNIGTEAALAAVRRSLQDQFDGQVAVSAFARAKEPGDFTGMLVQHLKEVDVLERILLLSRIFDEVVDLTRIDMLFRDPDLRELLRTEATADGSDPFVVEGNQLPAIRALARWNRATAVDALCRAIRSADYPARSPAAFQLADIDPEAAVPELFAQIGESNATEVILSMSMALASIIDRESLLGWFSSELPSDQLRGCRVAGYYQRDEAVDLALSVLLRDADLAVSKEALIAIRRRQICTEVGRIGEAFEAEKNAERRWLLLDAALALGDPGFENCPPPPWLQPFVKNMPLLGVKYITGRLDDRRRSRAMRLRHRDL